jgi:hypothetical protein
MCFNTGIQESLNYETDTHTHTTRFYDLSDNVLPSISFYNIVRISCALVIKCSRAYLSTGIQLTDSVTV